MLRDLRVDSKVAANLDEYCSQLPADEGLWEQLFLAIRGHERFKASGADNELEKTRVMNLASFCYHYVEGHIKYNYADKVLGSDKSTELWNKAFNVQTDFGSCVQTDAYRQLVVSHPKLASTTVKAGTTKIVRINQDTGGIKVESAPIRSMDAKPAGVAAGPNFVMAIVQLNRER